MRLVVALGGNALLRRHERADVESLRANVSAAVRTLAALAPSHELVVTHGNGPQIGLLALQAAAYPEVSMYPLDILGAESDGMIGYLLTQALTSQLPGRHVAALLTQVVVDPADAAFDNPSKPIGPVYDRAAADVLESERGWWIGPDGDGFRRLVPSPEPKRIVELATIDLLVRAGVLVVCVGGGGIPVALDEGGLHGVEAVIDKDLSAALLATNLHADALLLLTDVDGLYQSWGTATARRVAAAHPSAVRRLPLPAGSMGPKAEAAARYAEATGRPAFIGSLDAAGAMLDGLSGTRVSIDVDDIEEKDPPRRPAITT